MRETKKRERKRAVREQEERERRRERERGVRKTEERGRLWSQR